MALAASIAVSSSTARTGRPTFSSRLVTPDIAQAWIEEHTYKNQRPLRQAHVTFLATLMQKGEYRIGCVAITFAIYNEEPILINGQHTLHAIIQYGKALPLTVETYKVNSEEELATLYSSYDRHAMRTPGDVYRAHDLSGHYNIPHNMIESLSSALPIFVSGFDNAVRSYAHPLVSLFRSPESRIPFMIPWIPHALNYFEPCRVKREKGVVRFTTRAAVLAVGILTMRYQPQMAHTFWTQVAHGENLTHDMPAWRLRDFLFRYNPHTFRENHVYSRYVASAWNAFFDGRTLMKHYPVSKDFEMVIAGTPHGKNQRMIYYTPSLEPQWDATPQHPAFLAL